MIWPFGKKKEKPDENEKGKDIEMKVDDNGSVDPKTETRSYRSVPSPTPDEDTAVMEKSSEETKTQLANIKSALLARQERIQKMAEQVQKKHETKKVAGKGGDE